MQQHSVGTDGSTESNINDKSADIILWSDQQLQALPTTPEENRKDNAFLDLSYPIASTDGKLLADGMLIFLETSLN